MSFDSGGGNGAFVTQIDHKFALSFFQMQYYISNERRIKEMKSFGISEVKEEA